MKILDDDDVTFTILTSLKRWENYLRKRHIWHNEACNSQQRWQYTLRKTVKKNRRQCGWYDQIQQFRSTLSNNDGIVMMIIILLFIYTRDTRGVFHFVCYASISFPFGASTFCIYLVCVCVCHFSITNISSWLPSSENSFLGCTIFSSCIVHRWIRQHIQHDRHATEVFFFI